MTNITQLSEQDLVSFEGEGPWSDIFGGLAIVGGIVFAAALAPEICALAVVAGLATEIVGGALAIYGLTELQMEEYSYSWYGYYSCC